MWHSIIFICSPGISKCQGNIRQGRSHSLAGFIDPNYWEVNIQWGSVPKLFSWEHINFLILNFDVNAQVSILSLVRAW